EFDIGWLYIQLLSAVGLAKVKKLAPVSRVDTSKRAVDAETLANVLGARWLLLADYGREVLARVHREELKLAARDMRSALKRMRPLLIRNQRLLSAKQKSVLEEGLAENAALAKVYDFQQSLQAIFHQRQASEESLLQQLQSWCKRAEESGIAALAEFAEVVRGYSLQPNKYMAV
ncbi:MAG: transposase, partial [Pseudomonadota bacterium]